MNYIFKSQRLGFRNWEPADFAPFSEMNQDEDVMAFFPNKLTVDQSKAMIERMQNMYLRLGYTFYAVDQLATKEFIGFIGIIESTFEAHFTPCKEIGWRLKRAVWNEGYATEGALACMNFAFTNLGFTEICSITAVSNLKSEHIMKKIGMNYHGTFLHPKLAENDPLREHVLYKIGKNEFLERGMK